jgi:hypothetical protein
MAKNFRGLEGLKIALDQVQGGCVRIWREKQQTTMTVSHTSKRHLIIMIIDFRPLVMCFGDDKQFVNKRVRKKHNSKKSNPINK